MTTVGVLALQGDYNLHAERLQELGAKVEFIRKAEELIGIDALIIPGGESSTLLKLLDNDFRKSLKNIISSGLPTLGTCAGLILLAKEVHSPDQESLGCLNVSVERNSYGRQVDSFIEPNLQWTRDGRELLYKLELLDAKAHLPIIEGVFIRAPRIISMISPSQTSPDPVVEVILTDNKGEPVLVRQGNVLGASFHPEVSSQLNIVHEILLKFAKSREI